MTAIRESLLVVWCLEVFRGGVDALEEGVELGLWALVGSPDGVVQDLLHVPANLILFLVRELGVVAEPGAKALERVALRPLLEHLLRDVGGVVVDGVALHAKREALDQGGATALPRLLDRGLRFAVDRQDVRSVDDDAVEAVR